MIYTKKVMGQLSKLYYLVSLKRYLEDESFRKSVLTFIYVYKIINIFYKDYLKKPKILSLPINSASSITKLLTKLSIKILKWNQDRFVKTSIKEFKKDKKEDF